LLYARFSSSVQEKPSVPVNPGRYFVVWMDMSILGEPATVSAATGIHGDEA
jgi:hypothetical protein